MAEQQARTTTSSGFANADAIIGKVEELAKDTTIAVPAVVVASIFAFLVIIGLSWLMDGKKTREATAVGTPKKQPKLGMTVTPAGRRSTRKSHKPEILDPSR